MFWDNYMRMCRNKGETPNQVAEMCGVKSSGTVTGWKNGALPRPSVLKRIAEHFFVTVDDLLNENEKTATPEGSGVIPEYYELSDEDRAKVDDLIVRLAKGGK